jgi:uncharacterized membrane protein
VLIPATVTTIITRKVISLRSNNLFIFLLVIGFAGAMLSLFLSIVYILLFSYAVGNIQFFNELWGSLGIVIMIIYAEGFLNGMLVAAITVFAPDIVKTFDTGKYLGE